MLRNWGDYSDSDDDDNDNVDNNNNQIHVVISAADIQSAVDDNTAEAESMAEDIHASSSASAPPISILQRPQFYDGSGEGGGRGRGRGRDNNAWGRATTDGRGSSRYSSNDARQDHNQNYGNASQGSSGGRGGGRARGGGRGDVSHQDWKAAAKASSILKKIDDKAIDGSSWMAQRRAKQQEQEKEEREARAREKEAQRELKERRRSSQLEALKAAVQTIEQRKIEEEKPLTSLQAAVMSSASNSPLHPPTGLPITKTKDLQSLKKIEKIWTRQDEQQQEQQQHHGDDDSSRRSVSSHGTSHTRDSGDGGHGNRYPGRGPGGGRNNNNWARVPRRDSAGRGDTSRGSGNNSSSFHNRDSGRDSGREEWARGRSNQKRNSPERRPLIASKSPDTHIVQTQSGPVEYRIGKEASFTTKAELLPNGGVVISRRASSTTTQDSHISSADNKTLPDKEKPPMMSSLALTVAEFHKDDSEIGHKNDPEFVARGGRGRADGGRNVDRASHRDSGRGRGRHNSSRGASMGRNEYSGGRQSEQSSSREKSRGRSRDGGRGTRDERGRFEGRRGRSFRGRRDDT